MTAVEAAPDPLIGKTLAGRYRIEAKLGGGSMGAVYRARHVKVGRIFAVKVLHQHLLHDEKQRRRFAREAELAGTLHHPNVVGVVDVGEMADGQRYLVMEYAEGETLFGTIAASAPMAGPRVITLAQQLCDGLAHAHEHGLIHRDFKAENVIVERDRHGTETAKILDFGVAILRDNASSSEDRLTTAGLVLGTPHYMAPEHATNQAIDHRIDLFALGVISYEMLTGRLPFDGDGVTVARANMMLDPPAMSVRVAHLHVDPLLEAFVRKLMSRQRDLRPESAKAARTLLDQIVSDRPAAAAALGVELVEKQRGPITYDDTVPIATVSDQLSDDTAAVLRGMAMTPAAPMTQRVAAAASSRAGLAVAGLAGVLVIAAVAIALRPPSDATAPELIAPPRSTASTTAAAPSSNVASAPLVVAAPPAATAPAPTPSITASAPSVAPTPAVAPATAPNTTIVPRAAAARTTTVTPHPVTPAPVRPMQPPATRVATAAPIATAAPTTAAPTTAAPTTVAPTTVAPTTPPPTAPLATEPTAPPPQVAATPPAAAPVPAGPATASSVAQRYSAVAQHLKALEQAHGNAAAEDLWPIFLRIRINDAMSDPAKRDATDAVLRRLDDQIAQRGR